MDFNIDTLAELRIHELRDLARSVGVQSPTSKKKNEIINEILLIISGQTEPYINQNKQGRPAKSSLQINDSLVEYFVPKQDTHKDYNVSNEKFFDLYAFSDPASYNAYKSVNQNEFSGIVDIHENGFGLVRLNGFDSCGEDVFINIYDIKKYNLMAGDYITGQAKSIQADKPKVVTNIVSINGNVVDYAKTVKRFEDLEYNESNTIIQSNADNELYNFFKDKAPLYEGGKNLVLTEGLGSYEKIYDFAKVLDSEYCVLFINLNAKPSEKNIIKDNLEIVSIGFNKPENQQLSMANLVIERAKRKVENGKKVVVILNKISVLIKAINNINSKEYLSEILVSTIHRIKELLMCAKYVNNNKSLSLIVFDSMIEKTNIKDFIIYDLGQLFDNVVQIKSDCKGQDFFEVL